MRKPTIRGTCLVAGLAVLAIAFMPALAPAADVLSVQGDAVGIGVTTPAAGAKLHVRAASVGPVDAIFLENTTGPARLNLQNLSVSATATADPVWTINSNGDLRFTAGVDGAEMRIDAAGTLTVLTAVKVGGVTLNVPDYVFEPDYSLMSLDDLRSFVTENQHLPDVPSAIEVEREGLDMTDMQMRLLKKVEELTLYTLQQHETIEMLKAKIDSLEEEIR